MQSRIINSAISQAAELLAAPARMTQNQLSALRVRLDEPATIEELAALPYRNTIKRGAACQLKQVQKWALNAWNTEFLLRSNLDLLNGDGLRTSLHWAFPEAYYSVFTLMLACFHAVGHSETSHAAAIKKFGQLANAGKYPLRIGFLAGGGKKTRRFVNIARSPMPSTLTFNPSDPASVDTQICQFLNSTRKQELDARKPSIKVENAQGKRKSHFSHADWDLVSNSLGFTSVLSLLYRKRIKANYDDIDSFLSDFLDPVRAYQDLISIVSCLNMVHESFLKRALGDPDYDSIAQTATPHGKQFISKRMRLLRQGGA